MIERERNTASWKEGGSDGEGRDDVASGGMDGMEWNKIREKKRIEKKRGKTQEEKREERRKERCRR